MNTIFMLELRRMRLPLAVGAVVSALWLGLMYLVPMDRELFQIAVLVSGILLPSLWLILLFEPLADDREQLAFLGGLPVSLHRVFWLRVLSRLVLLMAGTVLLWRAIGFVENWGASIVNDYNRAKFSIINLIGVWLGVSGWLIFLSIFRTRPKMPRPMLISLIVAVFAQIVAVTFYTEINAVYYILLSGIQTFCLTLIAAWQLWRGACLNRRVGWWVVALMLLPVLQYGAVSAYWNTRLHLVTEKAKTEGIMIFPDNPGSKAELLKQLGYHLGAAPVYHANNGYSYNYRYNLQRETMDYYKKDDFERFFENAEIEWFLFGFGSYPNVILKICESPANKPNQLEWYRRLVEYLEKTKHRQIENRLILSLDDYFYLYWNGHDIVRAFGKWYDSGRENWYSEATEFLVQPTKAKAKVHIIEEAIEYFRLTKNGRTLHPKDTVKFRAAGQITGWHPESVDFMISVVKLRMYQLEHGEFPKSLPSDIAKNLKNITYHTDGRMVSLHANGGINYQGFRYNSNERAK